MGKYLLYFHNIKVASAFIVKNTNCILVFRLQVFHCLHHDGEGGETLLVDGFRAAYDLKQTHPKSFQRLTTLPIEAEYLEAGKHYINVDSMLKLHPLTKKLQQIR
jgi:trimethyllysine dioxygenase